MSLGPAGLGPLRGAALYVGALVGPGVLLVPSLADRAAGPASIIAWAALIALSAPLALVFSVLGVRHPVAGGVATYVEEGLGPLPAAATGACFLCAVVSGAPAVSVIGGFYVADLTGSGTAVAITVGIVMFGLVVLANALGLRVSSSVQLGLSAVLVVVIALAVGVALPARAGANWEPFAPKGWWAIGTSASILVWLFIGWEAMAQLVGDFKNPSRDLPRAVATAYGVIAVLYGALAVATVTVTAGNGSKVPLADLLAVGFGRAGRDATAVLAAVLTMGTMNVYLAGASKLATSLAGRGALPTWLGAGSHRDVPMRPLAIIGVLVAGVFFLLGTDVLGPDELVRVTSACFVAVYLLALASATRILTGAVRVASAGAFLCIVLVAIFSSYFLLAPLVASGVAVAFSTRAKRRPDLFGPVGMDPKGASAPRSSSDASPN